MLHIAIHVDYLCVFRMISSAFGVWFFMHHTVAPPWLHEVHGGKRPKRCLHRFVEPTEELIACLDANAAPGQADGRTVLSPGFATSSGTPLLRDFLDQFSLCLPITCDVHQGTRTTWVSPDDGEFTIDYVAVPQEWLSSCTLSTIVADFDLANVNVDHSVVAAEFTWRQSTRISSPSEVRIKTFDRRSIGPHLAESLTQSALCQWDDDVQFHADKITNHFHQVLRTSCPLSSQAPKKPYVSDEAWVLRTAKLRCRKHLAAGRALLRREALARTFFVLGRTPPILRRPWISPSTLVHR